MRLTVDLDFESIARNLLGGTDLEGMLGSGKQMRNMLQVPNVTLPDSPLGVLPQTSGGIPGLPGQSTPTPRTLRHRRLRHRKRRPERRHRSGRAHSAPMTAVCGP